MVVNLRIIIHQRRGSPLLQVCSLLLLITFVAEPSTLAAKADIPQGPPSTLKYKKPFAKSRMKPSSGEPLGPVNMTANAKKPKATSKASRHRILTENGVPLSGNTRAAVGQSVAGRAPGPGVVRSKWRE